MERVSADAVDFEKSPLIPAVVQNAETGKVCVLYVRKDGDYGLLEPEN